MKLIEENVMAAKASARDAQDAKEAVIKSEQWLLSEVVIELYNESCIITL